MARKSAESIASMSEDDTQRSRVVSISEKLNPLPPLREFYSLARDELGESDVKIKGKLYSRVLLGSDLVRWMCKRKYAADEFDVQDVVNDLIQNGFAYMIPDPEADFDASLDENYIRWVSIENDALLDLARNMKRGVEIKDRLAHLKRQRKTLVGKDAVAWLMTQDLTAISKAAYGYELPQDRSTAQRLGTAMIESGFILHATDISKTFEDDSSLYRFREDFRDPKKTVAGPYTFFHEKLGGKSTEDM